MKAKTIFIAAFFAVNFLMAQEPPPPPDEPPVPVEQREHIESVKAAFITREVGLTTEEAQKFWPVYNEMTTALEMLRKEKRMERKEGKKRLEELTDAETEKMVDNEIIFQQKELDIRKKYHAEFKKVLPIKKVARFYRAEQNFKREMLKRMREDRPQRPKQPMPPR